jgi:hypothetical protein
MPPQLEPFEDAIAIVAAVPDAVRREWYPEGHDSGLRTPFAAEHRHPVVKLALGASAHWDGVVPRYPCVRLDLRHPSVVPFAATLRSIAPAHIGGDEALYVYDFEHRSEWRCRVAALDHLAALLRAARDVG